MKTMKIWQKLDKHGQNQEFQGIPSKSQPGPIRAGNLALGGPLVASKLRASCELLLLKVTFAGQSWHLSCEQVASKLRASCEQVASSWRNWRNPPLAPPPAASSIIFRISPKKTQTANIFLGNWWFSWFSWFFVIFIGFHDFSWFSGNHLKLNPKNS